MAVRPLRRVAPLRLRARGQGDRAGGVEASADVVDRSHLELLGLQHPPEVAGDAGGRVLLEDADAAVAGDVVLEALELDAAVARDVGEPEQRVIRQPAVGADGAELPRLGDDLLLRAFVGEGLEDGDVDVFGSHKGEREAFRSCH